MKVRPLTGTITARAIQDMHKEDQVLNDLLRDA